MSRLGSWRIVLWLAVLSAALLGACGTGSDAHFPHRLHLAKIACGGPGQPPCLDCNTCHTVSKRDRAHKLPRGEVCQGCHRDDAHEVMSVLEVKPPRVTGPIQFDHDRHLAMQELQGQCVSCHEGVVEEGRASLPPMSRCFQCHQHQNEWKKGQCTPCHERASMARALPQSFLRHDQRFARGHGQAAQHEKQLCQSCHSQAQCDDCHDVSQDLSVEHRRPERIERNFVHRADFTTRHAIEAQSQPSKCLRCHTVETCDSCHVARGVSANRANGRNPHPPGWVGGNPGSRSFHGREARRDIVLCASCHEQGPSTNCIRCHKVGAYGGNPHPGGWRSSQSESSRMCRYCHE